MTELTDSTPEPRPVPTGGWIAHLLGLVTASLLLLVVGVALTFPWAPGESAGTGIASLLVGLVLIVVGLSLFLSAVSARKRASLLMNSAAALIYLALALSFWYTLPLALSTLLQ